MKPEKSEPSVVHQDSPCRKIDGSIGSGRCISESLIAQKVLGKHLVSRFSILWSRAERSFSLDLTPLMSFMKMGMANSIL